MKKKKIILMVLFAALLIPLSCKKGFLNTNDTSAFTASQGFTKAANIQALVNAIYNTYQSSDLLKKSIWYYANYETHDFFNNGSDIVNSGIGGT